MIVVKKPDEGKTGRTRKLICPICKKGRLCQIRRRHQATMCSSLEINDEILIRCPICNSTIGITLE
jgi:hypothetical protein